MQKYGSFQGFFIGFIGFLWVNLAIAANDITPTAPAASFIQLQAVQQFIQKMVSEYQFSANELNTWFQKITPNTRVIALMDKPAENLAWRAYQPLMVTEERIQQGIGFWQQHEAAVQTTAKKFGIAPEILIAILGLESFYGKITGNFSVLEALSTLAFQYPRRAAFFEKELAHYLLLTREEGLDPLSIKGSYAGAIGPAQFMPSSYRQYAISFNQQGQRDIVNNVPNILSSVANYFKSHGWQCNAPVAYSAQVSGMHYKKFQGPSNPSISAANTLESWNQYGVTIKDKDTMSAESADTKTLAKLLILEGKAGQEYWMTYPNFDVIKSYNQSNHYAMAVYLLSKQIRAGRATLGKNLKKSGN
jgi:membrane-bound lytic murein transglycosylase B